MAKVIHLIDDEFFWRLKGFQVKFQFNSMEEYLKYVEEKYLTKKCSATLGDNK